METERKSNSYKILITIMLLATIIVAEFVFIVYQKQNINSLNSNISDLNNNISKLTEELNTSKTNIEELNNKISSSNAELQKKLKSQILEYMVSDASAEEFINNLYFYSDSVMATFDDINNANDKWIWSRVYDVFLQYRYDEGISYEDINTAAKIIYGDKFTLEFPKEKSTTFGFEYNSEKEKYFLDEEYNYYSNDSNFGCYIANINENNKISELEIVEYVINYNENNDEENIVEIYDANNNFVKTYEDITYYNDIIEQVEDDIKNSNIELHPNKKIILSIDNEGIYHIDSIEQI